MRWRLVAGGGTRPGVVEGRSARRRIDQRIAGRGWRRPRLDRPSLPVAPGPWSHRAGCLQHTRRRACRGSARASPAAPPPAACASAIELVSAKEPANTTVSIFTARFPCACCDGITRYERSMFLHLFMSQSATRFHKKTARDTCRRAFGSSRNYLASVGKIFIRHRFQMRSITAKLVWSAFAPSPGVR